jgi:hypothetical protein
MSRGALGKAVFVSESLVTEWEKASYLPKPDVMDRLEGTLGTRGVLTRMLDGGSDVAYVDNQLSGEVVEHTEDVTRLRRMFEVFRADALPQRESVELIIGMAEQWKA